MAAVRKNPKKPFAFRGRRQAIRSSIREQGTFPKWKGIDAESKSLNFHEELEWQRGTGQAKGVLKREKDPRGSGKLESHRKTRTQPKVGVAMEKKDFGMGGPKNNLTFCWIPLPAK